MLNLTVVIPRERLMQGEACGAFVAVIPPVAATTPTRPRDPLAEPAAFTTAEETPSPIPTDADLRRPARGDPSVRAYWRRRG